MAAFLYSFFILSWKGGILISTQTAANYREIKKVLWLILFANFGVAALKIVIGGLIQSASLTADGFHSLTDGSSNIVGLIGVRIASKPVDDDHPYGHRKYETLTGMFIAGMLLLIGGKIIFDAIGRFSTPVMPTVNVESLIALLVTLGVNVFVATYENRRGKALGSTVLISDSMHTKSDIFVSIGVLVTLIGLKLGLPAWVDSVASLLVAGFILKAAVEIFKSTSTVLVDGVCADSDQLKAIAMSFPQVKDVHKIRSRGTAQDAFIDMHVMIDPQTPLQESHDLAHEIEERINEEMKMEAQLIVHLEPYFEDPDKKAQIKD